MAWPAFADALEAAWRRDGYTVTRTQGAADFELVKEGRRYVVAARRWKAAHTGLEPLRELVKAKEAREAQEATWVTAGELTAEARAYADRAARAPARRDRPHPPAALGSRCPFMLERNLSLRTLAPMHTVDMHVPVGPPARGDRA